MSSERSSAIPDPTVPSAPHAWGEPVRGRVESADGSSPWSAADPPGEVPPPIAGVDGPHTRPGWLMRGRSDA
ncbi:hypothetical protein [Pseudonocardia endophytica]|nr:hypothetical protein [Pseudonocardia endophytica]